MLISDISTRIRCNDHAIVCAGLDHRTGRGGARLTGRPGWYVAPNPRCNPNVDAGMVHIPSYLGTRVKETVCPTCTSRPHLLELSPTLAACKPPVLLQPDH